MRCAVRVIVFVVTGFVVGAQTQAQSFPREGPTPKNTIVLQPVDPSEVKMYSGESAGIGAQHGQTEGVAMARIVDEWLRPKLNVIPLLPTIFADWKVAQMWPHIPSRFKTELRSLATASGVSYNDTIIANLVVDIAELVHYPFGCSVLALAPMRSATGSMLIGRNLDYSDSDSLRGAWRPVIYERTGAKRIVGIELPGYLGVLSSINEDGVFIARLTSYNDDVTANGFPTTLAFRHILENAGSAEEALRLWQSTRRTVAVNVLIADSRAAYVAESTATMVRVRTLSNAGTLYAANHFESPDLADGVHGRDSRWPVLAGADSTQQLFGISEMAATLCAAASLPSNILGVIVDYATKRLYFASGGTNGQPASCGSSWRHVSW